jgi:hypothetical protein
MRNYRLKLKVKIASVKMRKGTMNKRSRIGFLTPMLLPIFFGSLVVLSACNNQTDTATNGTTDQTQTTDTTTQTPPTETPATDQATQGDSPITIGLEGDNRQNTDPLELIQSEQVKTELNITDDQIAQLKTLEEELRATLKQKTSGIDMKELQKDDAKIKALYADIDKDIQASREKVGQILKPEQIQRLRGISLQLFGFGVLTLADVEQDLKITPEQKAEMDTLREELFKNMKASWEIPTGTAEEKQKIIANNRKKMDQIVQENNSKALALLTDEQKQTLETLKGEKFVLDETALTPPQS